jgi:hypothetical protein
MSSRLEKSWLVASHQTADAGRCVDIFSRPDGTFGFEEFRRDPEDMGVWTPVSYYSGLEFATEADATAAARHARALSGPAEAGSWMSAHTRPGKGPPQHSRFRVRTQTPGRDVVVRRPPRDAGEGSSSQPDEMSDGDGVRNGPSLVVIPFRHRQHPSEVLTGPKW